MAAGKRPRRQTGIPRACFEALVREELQRHMRGGRVSDAAVRKLHAESEAYLCWLLRCGDRVREATGRATLLVRHVRCVQGDD